MAEKEGILEKRRIYTQEYFKKRLKWAVIGSGISFVEHCVVCLWMNVQYLEMFRNILVFIKEIVNPVILLVLWGWCIIYYLRMKMQTAREEGKRFCFIGYCIIIGVIVFFGQNTYDSACAVVSYVSSYWKLLDSVYFWVAVKAGIFAGWLFCWVCSIRLMKMLCTEGKWVRKAVLLLLAGVIASLLLNWIHTHEYYAQRDAEHAHFLKMVEYYDEHGTRVDVPPYFSQ